MKYIKCSNILKKYKSNIVLINNIDYSLPDDDKDLKLELESNVRDLIENAKGEQ